MLAPAGTTPPSEYERVKGGVFGSEANVLTSKLKVAPAFALWLGIAIKTGGKTGVAERTTVKPAIVVFGGEPLSVTSTVNG